MIIGEHVEVIGDTLESASGESRVAQTRESPARETTSRTDKNDMDNEVRTLRIVIADDHAIFRDGLRKLLEAEAGFEVVGQASDGREAIELVRQLRPDVLLLDHLMPRLSGLDALAELASASEPVRTIVLTAAIGRPEIVRALQLGAQGVVLKASATQLLYKCIRTVVAGECWVGRESVSDLVEALRQLEPPPPAQSDRMATLTHREREIVAAIARGASNRDIARALDLSEQTVKNHLSSIFEKCGVSNRVELALLAVSPRETRTPQD